MVNGNKIILKFLVADFFPKCVNCIHYKPSIINSYGSCKIFGIILDARINKSLCGLEGTQFKKQIFVKK